MARQAENLRLLRDYPSFTALWASETISTLGDRIHRVALAALVYQLTGSLTETGIAFVATALPDLLFGLLAGVYVDRWDRRRVLIVCDLLRIPLVIAIPLVADQSLLGVYLLLFAVNTLSIVFRPAKNALVPSVVPAGRLTTANSLSSISENISDVVGYPLAGVLLGGFSAWFGTENGIRLAFFFDGLTYFVSALFLLGVRPRRAVPVAHSAVSVWNDLREGLVFVWRSSAVRANTVVMLLGPLTIGAATPLLVGYAWEVLQGGEWEYAMLGTAISVGSIVGGLWLSASPVQRPGLSVVVGLAVMGISVMATAVVSTLWVAMLSIALSGVGSMMVLIPSVTLVQQMTPEQLLGRVFSLRSTLIFAAIIASNAAGGWAGEVFGVRQTFFSCGALLVLATVVAAVFPSVRDVTTEPATGEYLSRG